MVNHRRTIKRNWQHRLITGFVTRLTPRVSLVEQELLTLPKHRSSPPVFSGVRVTRSLVLYVCFVDHCFSFSTFSFGHCVVCSSLIYGFWLPLWYLQTVRTQDKEKLNKNIMFVSLNSTTMAAANGVGTSNSSRHMKSPQVSRWLHVAQFLDFCMVIFVHAVCWFILIFGHCIVFSFDLWFLVISFVFSNFTIRIAKIPVKRKQSQLERRIQYIYDHTRQHHTNKHQIQIRGNTQNQIHS
jgi:hypothetical protein